jgi:hypothetical protein
LDGTARIKGAHVDIGAYEYDRNTYDSDGDGMPDGWEDDHTLSPINAADKHLNKDLDPVDNYGEYLADTHPANPNLYFHLSAISNTPAAKVFFGSSSNRSYRLLSCGDLTKGSWSNVTGRVRGTGAADSLTDPGGLGTNRAYRVSVGLP